MVNSWRPCRTIVEFCVVFAVLLSFMHARAHAQALVRPVSYAASLPSAPKPAQATESADSAAQNAAQASSAAISGTVLDTTGAVLEGVKVTLLTPTGITLQTEISGVDGQFTFSGLPSAGYEIRVSAPGMRTYTSPQITLNPGEFHFLPPINLAIAIHSISVTVIGNKQVLSVQQVKIAEQQKIIGVIPNFYTTYDWNAPPMLAKQKFALGFRSVLDPMSFAAVAGVAGTEQYYNIFPEYGSGFQGYAKRYGTAFATHFTADILSQAVYPAIFHQDPRYFYKGKGSFGSRAFYAISSTFIARGDNGHLEPNYSDILGDFSAAAISNLYYPPAERGGSLVLFNGLADVGADATLNLMREFIINHLTSHATKDLNGEPGN